MLAILFRRSMRALRTRETMESIMSEKFKIASEISKMTSADFASMALRDHLAPRRIGPVKVRLQYARTKLASRNWSANRVRDLWYRDRRSAAPSADEILDIEELTGLHYARRELTRNDELISRADALLLGSDPDFYGAFVAAFRQFLGASNSAGTGGRTDTVDRRQSPDRRASDR